MHREGFYVLGLRLPGHGTAPSALTKVNHRDWMAAVRIGGRSVRARIGDDRPFFIIGYSNGGALAVKYALEALEDPDLPKPDQLILFSPAIGITRYASLSRWATIFAHIAYFAKSRWQTIAPEYDPFKYNSFPLNAADQTYRLARSLKRDLARLEANGMLAQMPPVLTFQSLIDSTVHASAIAEQLYDRLESPESELVLFDINRYAPLKYFVAADPADLMRRIDTDEPFPHRITLLTNTTEMTNKLVVKTKLALATQLTIQPLDLAWPNDVYSLSHVSLPFPPDDPLYGAVDGATHYGLHLGRIEIRGEKSLLQVSAEDYMRLRFNPFFSYVEKRLLDTVRATHGR